MDRIENQNRQDIRPAAGTLGWLTRRPLCACGGDQESERVKALIREYPRIRVELLAREKDVIFGRGDREPFLCSGSWAARPTEVKMALLDADERIRHLRRLCTVVLSNLNLLQPEYRRVICLRFWGLEDEEQAVVQACAGKALFGLRYGSTRGLRSVEELAGYSERQARRIVRLYLTMIREEIERLGIDLDVTYDRF